MKRRAGRRGRHLLIGGLLLLIAPNARPEKPVLSPRYATWLSEEVVYLISEKEKSIFLKLETDRDRDLFMEAFWRQRDPVPQTPENEYREEHYRRLRYANAYAPEHLEVHTRDPREILPWLGNYGSLFLGQNTAEVYADKIAGTNHILPTGRAAKYTGGLWIGMFLKVITHQAVDVKASLMLAQYAETQAAYEGMDAHRYAATIRLKTLK